MSKPQDEEGTAKCTESFEALAIDPAKCKASRKPQAPETTVSSVKAEKKEPTANRASLAVLTFNFNRARSDTKIRDYVGAVHKLITEPKRQPKPIAVITEIHTEAAATRLRSLLEPRIDYHMIWVKFFNALSSDHYGKGGSGADGIAIIFPTDQYALEDERHIVSQHGKYIAVSLTTKEVGNVPAGLRIGVIGVHLPNGRNLLGHTAAINLVRQKAKSMVKHSHAVIVAGDFNCSPDAIQKELQGFGVATIEPTMRQTNGCNDNIVYSGILHLPGSVTVEGRLQGGGEVFKMPVYRNDAGAHNAVYAKFYTTKE